MSKEYPHTFISWQKEKCGEVSLLPPDAMGEDYQSPYLFKFNYLKDKGWRRENKKWVSPSGQICTNIENAYGVQKYEEAIDK